MKWRPRYIVATTLAAVLIPTGLSMSGLVDFPSINFGEPVITETNGVPLLIAIRNISEYHAATGKFNTLAERDVDNAGPDFLTGQHVTVYAVGTVDAYVNFGQITPDSVEINDERTSVTIHLPAPVRTPVQLDPFETKVVNNERGIVERINDGWTNVPDTHHDVLVQAAGQIQMAAAQSDLVDRAEDSTREMLTGLCNSLGYTEVNITFAPAIPPGG